MKKWQVACKELCDGTIRLGDMDSLMGEFQHDMVTMEQELMKMTPPGEEGSWVGERVDQIKRYYTLMQYKQAAEVILATRRELGLTGDFRKVEHLLSAVSIGGVCQSSITVAIFT